MKLDSRIIDGKKPLDCFEISVAKEFIGKECYFSDSLSDFLRLSCFTDCPSEHRRIGTLRLVSETDVSPFYLSDLHSCLYILPCEWVKESEKKLRPYTIAEFQEAFTVGKAVRFRRKDAPTKEHLLIFGGYYTLHDGRVSILFGIHLYTLEELFEQYEWQEFYTDEYRPFGIEE